MNRSHSNLKGKHIVVTRPRVQAVHLADELIARGARPVLYPALEIAEPEDQGPVKKLAERLDAYHWAIFVSPNAVEYTLRVLLSQRVWPTHLKVAAIGQSSRLALQRFGIESALVPEGRFDSEALAELSPMKHVDGLNILIFRAGSGRDWLGDTLGKRGARIEYIASYERRRPVADAERLHALYREGLLSAVTVTSSESLRNLATMIGPFGQVWLRMTPCFVTHQRILELGRRMDIHKIILTPPADEGLLAGLEGYFQFHHARDQVSVGGAMTVEHQKKQ